MSNSPIRILLIEDDPVDVVLVKRALRQSSEDFELTNCQTLVDAISIIPKTDFHAVLVDLSSHDCGGVEGVTQLVTAAPDTPIVVLTGLADNELALSALEAGAQDYLLKGKT